MGQTLSNGVYLPNEGERNCYAGLASNWQILNTAVGAITEKAPLVHTHGNITNDGKVGTDANKPLITGTGGAVQAGSFGNAANTFCEGNDSRLSDARTPVAHTHTKSDVTDLLNSNFIPSANNSYDLGSSSYQWNNLYAKNYYYNGVAWGLDKANTWTGTNTFAAVSYGNKVVLKNTGLDLSNGNSGLTDTYLHFIQWVDNSNTVYAMLQSSTKSANTTTVISNKYKTDANTSVTAELKLENSGTAKSFYSSSNGDTDLGTSSKRWKSLNGINPGALSLPNVRAAEADPISTVGWNLSGSRNKYTPTEDGWFYIRVAGTGSCAINIHNGDTDNSYPTWFNTSTGGYATLVVPCEKGISLYIYISATSIEYCSFHPCLGNV